MKGQPLIRIGASVLIILLFLAMPLPVSANGPPPPPWLSVRVTNLPREAVYADILIRIDETDANFTHINESNLELFGLSIQSEIVGLNIDGFMSFTFHYRDAAADIYIERETITTIGRVSFGREDGHAAWLGRQLQDLRSNYNDMKIVLLGYSGNVISVSEQFSLPREFERGVWTDLFSLTYDHQSGEVSFSAWSNSFRVIFMTIPLIVVIMAVSISLELVTALFFGFRRKKLELVFGTNLATQAIMWVVYYRFLFHLPHIVAILILEAAIYAAEFYIYRTHKEMADESTSRLLKYTIVANTLSLIVGVLVFW